MRRFRTEGHTQALCSEKISRALDKEFMKVIRIYDLLASSYLLLLKGAAIKKINLRIIQISLNILCSWYVSNSLRALEHNTKLISKVQVFHCVGRRRSATFNCLQSVDKDQRYTRGNDVAVIHSSFVIPSPFFTLSPASSPTISYFLCMRIRIYFM